MAPRPLGVKCHAPHSPTPDPTSAMALPPTIIWIAAPT